MSQFWEIEHEDARLASSGLMNMVSNRRLAENGPDFYPTPAWGTRALMDRERFRGGILEPCCGDGAMAEVIEQYGYRVSASDKYKRGYGQTRDVFDIRKRHANLVTNPPFPLAEAILEHAFGIIDRKICLLLRTAFLESSRRWKNIYSTHPPCRILIFSERLTMYPKGRPVAGGGTTSHAWFVWDVRAEVEAPTIEWIEPGSKSD